MQVSLVLLRRKSYDLKYNSTKIQKTKTLFSKVYGYNTIVPPDWNDAEFSEI